MGTGLRRCDRMSCEGIIDDEDDPYRRCEFDECYGSGCSVRSRPRRVPGRRHRLWQSRMLSVSAERGSFDRTRGVFRRPGRGRRGAALRRFPGGRPRQQCQLRRSGDHGIDRATRPPRHRAYRGRRQPDNRPRSRGCRAERCSLRLLAAQLGLLADQSRGRRGRGRHRGGPGTYGLPRADAWQPSAGEPPGHSTRNRHLGGRRLFAVARPKISRRCASAPRSSSPPSTGDCTGKCCDT